MSGSGNEKKAVIKNADMADETQQDAIDVALQVDYQFYVMLT